MLITCPVCELEVDKPKGAVNRAKKKGLSIYCGRECAGIARRNSKTVNQKKAEKAAYDKLYRAKNADRIKKEKAEWFRQTYDPVKAAEERKKNMHKHVQYCRQPKYRARKKEYDRAYRAKKHYGEFWEAQVLSLKIREECLKRQSDYEIRLEIGNLNKAQRRKRDVTTNSRKLERSPLGYIAAS